MTLIKERDTRYHVYMYGFRNTVYSRTPLLKTSVMRTPLCYQDTSCTPKAVRNRQVSLYISHWLLHTQCTMYMYLHCIVINRRTCVHVQCTVL